MGSLGNVPIYIQYMGTYILYIKIMPWMYNNLPDKHKDEQMVPVGPIQHQKDNTQVPGGKC